ncbi:MAG TPA: DUF2243 domain-containing protein, partial [Baekduia sp.]|nr:DUF2243 domain-containing protein [Baekduia sp.]
ATMERASESPALKPSRAGILIGIGLGGFVDGIVLHQIFQWHNMVSNWVPPINMENMKLNMTWDGLFHALMWFFSLAGVTLLWRDARRDQPMPATVPFFGQLIFGWGVFNMVEGLINHQILGAHHVREVPDFLVYDLAFLALAGVGLLLLGLFLMRRQ